MRRLDEATSPAGARREAADGVDSPDPSDAAADIPLLFERSKRGDRAAFDGIVRALWDPVMRVLWKRLPSDDATDVAQTVFASLYRTLRNGGGPVAASEADCRRYVVASARRQLIDRRRRESVRPALAALDALFDDDGAWADAVPDAGAGDPSRAASDRERDRAITDCLGKLDVLPRAICWLHFVEGVPKREVARVLVRPESSIRLLLDETLAALRRCLAPRGFSPDESVR